MPYPFDGPHCLACVSQNGSYSQWCQGLGNNFVCTAPCKEYVGEQPTPTPQPIPTPQPTPSPQPTPAPTTTPASQPTPAPPSGGCEHEKDCDVSPWCNDTGFETWCRQ